MKIKKTAIAFDLGLNFGYADATSSGSIRVDDSRRMFSFYDHALSLLMKKKYKVVLFEDAKFQKGNAIYNFNAQKGILQLLAESLGMDFVGYSPMTIKKALTGSAKASKEQMIKEAEKLRKKEIKKSDEADAIGVYHTYLTQTEGG